jgi:hypothetical protein
LLYQTLPLKIDGKDFAPYKFGLTIYDDVRVDVFREGKFGLTGSVNCFTPAMSYFKIVLDRTHEYFAELWERAMPFGEFLAALDAARAEF